MTVPLKQAQATLASLVERVENGETVTIERDGMPVARIVGPGVAENRRRSFGIWEGAWPVDDSAFSPEAEQEIEDLFLGTGE
ncbi:MAG: type II toxin-antitoxin system prevent-host-death family antitoxin [Bacteroidota bacterium]